ncbi:MAG: lipid A deacylase LpxR family protein [Candidatus Competibacter sp.]
MIRLTVIAGFFILATATVNAQQYRDQGTLGFLVENDKFTGTDEHYTNGVELTYLTAKDDVPQWLRSAAVYLPGVRESAALRTGYVLGQSIFTPSNTLSAAPVPNERPYAGWLYGGLALVAEDDGRLDTWELQLGIVGPSARGEEVQNSFHDLIGSDEAAGWDNQLHDEFGYALIYERKWRNLLEHQGTGLGVDVTPYVGGSLGNVGTYLEVGATLRIGNDLPNDYGAPRIRPSLPGSNFFLPRDNFGWYLFAGAGGRAVAYNIFLDGNTDGNSLGVDRKPFVGELQAGLVTSIGWARLAYTYVLRTREFDRQDKPDRFGSVGISFKF